MIPQQLFLEFLKIGLFSFGGGYATIPFLYHISKEFAWYTLDELSQMIAIASVTPGPVGINVATYAGLKTAGFLGAAIATISEMLPSFFLVLIVSKLLKRYSENFIIKSAIETLKPLSCALLASVAFGLLRPEIQSLKSIVLLSFLIILSWKTKKDPLFYMLIAGIVGFCLVILHI